MVRESEVYSLHVIAETLRSRIRLLELYYIVLSGWYGMSLFEEDPVSTVITLKTEISHLLEELAQCPGGKREWEKIKESYNQTVKLWDLVVLDGSKK